MKGENDSQSCGSLSTDYQDGRINPYVVGRPLLLGPEIIKLVSSSYPPFFFPPVNLKVRFHIHICSVVPITAFTVDKNNNGERCGISLPDSTCHAVSRVSVVEDNCYEAS